VASPNAPGIFQGEGLHAWFRSTHGRVHLFGAVPSPRGAGAAPFRILGAVAEYVTIPDVELLTVGMNWHASTGDVTFRFEHLRDAMVAANEDPHVVPPRLKIGHVDPRFADAEDPGHNPFFDGEPAFGSIENLRLVNDGAVLIGDYVEVPVWLAEALPSAYPSRSVEGARTNLAEPDGYWNVETPGGKTYTFVLTACALLGLSRPAVQDLEDLRRFLVEGEGLVVAGTQPEGGEPVSASIPTVPKPKTSQPTDCTASVDKVIENYIFGELPDDPSDPMYWWWIRDVLTEPNVLIVDTDEGDLMQVEFSSDDTQTVTYGEPERVLQTFVKAPAAAMRAAAAALAPEGSRVLATFGTREESPAAKRNGKAPEGGEGGPGRTSGMDSKALLRETLGLPADATDAQIEAAAAAAKVALAEDPPAGDPPADPPAGDPPAADPPADPPAGDPPAGDPPADPPAGDPPADPPAATGAEDGTVRVPKDVWESVQAGAKAGTDLAAVAEEEKRDSTIEAACLAGKISPSQEASMVNLHERDREGFYTLLTAEVSAGGLQPGIVPTTQAGHSKQVTAASASEVSPEEMAHLGFPTGPQPIGVGGGA
jgi:Mu-like prophage I protein